jgi:DMSO/TMAO reductase YedYZ heme-binding membrane subunit
MKTYFNLIKNLQELLLGVSILILTTLPIAILLTPYYFNESGYTWLYAIAHLSLFLVMIIRPLADVFKKISWIRPLVILRKGLGVLSASIIVSLILVKIMIDPGEYFSSFINYEYWSPSNLSFLAHIADISAILLLITSNNLSKKLLGNNWKRIQRLAYVYFYGSGLYVFLSYGDKIVFTYLVLVTFFTLLAWAKNHNLIRE